MEQNKVRTYLLYAIGEIALVMIGILLALQVNNFNENKKTRKTETKLLNELKGDLIKTREDLLTDIQKTNSILVFTDSLNLAIIEGRNTNKDIHLSIPVYQLSDTPILFPKLSAYKSIQAYGINIVSNDSLRKYLTELYELQLERVRYTELLLTELHETELRQYFKRVSKPDHFCEECISLADKFENDRITRQNIFVLKNPQDEFLHMLKRRYAITRALKARYNILNEEIGYMVEIIDKEMAN